jgi:hypothetical protein
MRDNTALNSNIWQSYFVDSGKESSRSIADQHANGSPTSFVERRKGRWDSQTVLVRSVLFWSVFYKNDFHGNRTGINHSIYRWAFRIQRRGRCIVDGKGNHVSRLRGYRTLVPDDGDVAIRFSHTLRGGPFSIPFDQDGNCRL